MTPNHLLHVQFNKDIDITFRNKVVILLLQVSLPI